MERLRLLGGRLHLLQILIALPDGHEDMAPSWQAVAPDEVPERRQGGAHIRVLAGEGTVLAYPGRLLLEDVSLGAGARYACPPMAERALHVLEGSILIGETTVHANQTVLLHADSPPASSADGARLLALGGDPVGPRYSWWNFIHSSLDAIEQAKARWRAREYFVAPPGDTESFTPAPPDDGRPLMRINQAAPSTE
jgi:redox-sensitive bicupin YhaK (pirin superfamily)